MADGEAGPLADAIAFLAEYEPKGRHANWYAGPRAAEYQLIERLAAALDAERAEKAAALQRVARQREVEAENERLKAAIGRAYEVPEAEMFGPWNEDDYNEGRAAVLAALDGSAG